MTSGLVLGGNGHVTSDGALTWDDGRITEITTGPLDDVATIDASGCWVLPGVIDLHGDAFERSWMPRPGVSVAPDAALADNDTHLLAAGITTSYLSATDSWEPGLRSRETLRTLVAALAGRRPGGPDVRLHVRHERCAVDGIDELQSWVADGTITMLSFNDHTPGGIAHITGLGASQVQRSGVTEAELEQRMHAAIAARPTGLAQEEELAATARSASCPLASHDASSEADLARDRQLGVAIAEFPMTVPLARRYLDEGIQVLLGAPNLVRGASHLGNLSVRDAVEDDACSLVCSDYHYPSLLQAPFVLEQCGIAALPEAWSLVAEAPAAAAGLHDRGVLEPGRRADLIVVEPPQQPTDTPVVRAVVSDGRVAYRRP